MVEKITFQPRSGRIFNVVQAHYFCISFRFTSSLHSSPKKKHCKKEGMHFKMVKFDQLTNAQRQNFQHS